LSQKNSAPHWARIQRRQRIQTAVTPRWRGMNGQECSATGAFPFAQAPAQSGVHFRPASSSNGGGGWPWRVGDPTPPPIIPAATPAPVPPSRLIAFRGQGARRILVSAWGSRMRAFLVEVQAQAQLFGLGQDDVRGVPIRVGWGQGPSSHHRPATARQHPVFLAFRHRPRRWGFWRANVEHRPHQNWPER